MFLLKIVVFCLLAFASANCSSDAEDTATETYNEDFLAFLDNYDLVDTLTDVPVVKTLTTILVGALVNLIGLVVDILLPVRPLPTLDKDIWWGSISRDEQDTSIRPFEVQFKPERLQRLKAKLEDRDYFTEPLDGANFTYGMNTTFLDEVLEYWLNEYDFKARQAKLNEYPQYITNIQGLDIHYYHIKPKTTKKVIPLLMLHGWPVFNMEYIHMFSELTNEKEGYDFVFEIIAPNIPGFGYSEGTSKIGLSTYQIGIIFKNLMSRIGYEKFYIHGGDFGELIGSTINTIYQDDILGFHTNFAYTLRLKPLVKTFIATIQPAAVVEPEYEERLFPVLNVLYYFLRNFGYFHMHATKPDTLGVALLDSPSGLASWVLTTFSWLTNPNYDLLEDGGLPDSFDMDDLLDVLTIWWDTESIATSIRIYAESLDFFQDPVTFQILQNPTKVPYSCIKFRWEVLYMPDQFIEDKYTNIVQSTTLDYGGHFAGFENPDVMSDHIWLSVSKIIEYSES